MNNNRSANTLQNLDRATVTSFGAEWKRFDQSPLPEAELARMFDAYFSVFPWHRIASNAQGFDMGCGSGRWAKLVVPRVGVLHCIDASADALDVARRTLSDHANVKFHHASASDVPLDKESLDFGYSLGVLHHIPDTEAALKSCVDLLKPGAPMLVYLYYRFDNRPLWFRLLWRASEVLRAGVSRLPEPGKSFVTDAIAALVYFPLARASRLAGRLGFETRHFPLQFYKAASFYTMRTDCRDRFGTPLEKRFTCSEVKSMMERAGLSDIVFSEREPYWCAAGIKSK